MKDLSELLGILLGDGHIHKYSNTITIVGSLEDLKYYKYKVIPLIKKLFSNNPSLRKRNDRNAYYIDFTSKKIMDYLLKIGMNRGNKINAKIPKFIYKKENINNFLRGLFDTDEV